MRWGEVDRVNGVWTIPAERCKNGEEHTVDLSPQALAILEANAPTVWKASRRLKLEELPAGLIITFAPLLLQLALLDLEYYPMPIGNTLHRSESIERGMLDDITELRTFVSIVGAGSLSAAAREMDLALSVVSKRLAALERRAEARLIARSTRRLALTDEGQTFMKDGPPPSAASGVVHSLMTA